MELIIVLLVTGFLVWFFFLRDKEDIKEAMSEAPYKVDVTPEPAPKPVTEPVKNVTGDTLDTTQTEEVKPVKAKRASKPKVAKSDNVKTRAKKPKMEVAK